jgi:hypothetical protein
MRNLVRRLRYELPSRADLNLLFFQKRGPTGSMDEVWSLAPYLQARGFLPNPPWKGMIQTFEPRKEP